MDSCEAMVEYGNGERYQMCGKPDTETHHMITRSRGGKVLDKIGETYHLARLCHDHHMQVHQQGEGYKGGFLIRGYVTTGVDGKPVYVGPDEYLAGKYPA
jgi:hypothetical protein